MSPKGRIPLWPDELAKVWPELSLIEKAVAGAFLNLMGPDGLWFGPRATISAQAGLSPNSTDRAIEGLEVRSLLLVHKTGKRPMEYAWSWPSEIAHRMRKESARGEESAGGPLSSSGEDSDTHGVRNDETPSLPPSPPAPAPSSPPNTPLVSPPLSPTTLFPHPSVDKAVSKPGKAENQVILDYFAEKFKAHTGQPYTIQWGKETKLLLPYIKTHGARRLCGLIDRFFSEPTAYCQENGFTVGLFAMEINRILSRAAAAEEGSTEEGFDKFIEARDRLREEAEKA